MDARVSLRGLIAWSLVALCEGPAAGVSAAPTGSPDTTPLRSAVDADVMTVAEIAARIGDDAVLAALAQHADVMLRLAAVRSAPFLHAPAAALPELIALAQGRDPELAPAAARRVRAIAQALSVRPAGVREQYEETLAAALKALDALSADATAAHVVRLSAGEASALLRNIPGP
jgi:hypothetical protein